MSHVIVSGIGRTAEFPTIEEAREAARHLVGGRPLQAWEVTEVVDGAGKAPLPAKKVRARKKA